MSPETSAGTSRGYYDSAIVAPTDVVPNPTAMLNRQPKNPSMHIKNPTPSTLKGKASIEPEIKTDWMSCIRNRFEKQELSEDSIKLVLASWRDSTKSEYSTYISKWIIFCNTRSYNPLCAPINQITDFLTCMFLEGKSYSTINLARSALSALGIKYDGISVGSHPTIVRLLKGMFNLRPTKARYTETWDANIVLRYLKNIPVDNESYLKELTMKLTMLLALTLAARPQTLHYLTTKDMVKTENKIVLSLSAALKHTRPGKPLEKIEVNAYPHDRSLCVYTTLNEYLSCTEQWREKDGPLFISYVKPHKPVSRDTVKRWIKTVMDNAGIDTSKFRAYSTRSASTSKAVTVSTPIECILKTAGWSRESTFAKSYHKNIVTEQSFSVNILKM